MQSEETDWDEVRSFYEDGHTGAETRLRFDLTHWEWHRAVGRGEVKPRNRGDLAAVGEKRQAVGEMRARGMSLGQIASELGLSKSTVAYHASRLGEEPNEKCSRRYDWAEVQRALDDGASVDELVLRFGFSRASYSKAVRRGDLVPRPRRRPLEEVLVVGRKCNNTNLKLRLLDEGLLVDRCDACGICDWQEEPLSMQLHHLNGDNRDNRLENLRLLCPNCHSQTENWGSRAKRRPLPPA